MLSKHTSEEPTCWEFIKVDQVPAANRSSIARGEAYQRKVSGLMPPPLEREPSRMSVVPGQLEISLGACTS